MCACVCVCFTSSQFRSWCYLLSFSFVLFFFSMIQSSQNKTSPRRMISFVDDFSIVHFLSLYFDYCHLPLSLFFFLRVIITMLSFFCLAFVLGCLKDEHNMIVNNSLSLSLSFCNCTTNEFGRVNRRRRKKIIKCRALLN